MTNEQWMQTREALAKRIGKNNYVSWIEPLHLRDLADVLPGDGYVEHHREAEGLDHVRHLDLQVEGARADQRVIIPMAAGVESLNVGAAVAVCLFEQARQGGLGGTVGANGIVGIPALHRIERQRECADFIVGFSEDSCGSI